MTIDQLPERLRNINGLQMVTGERVTVTLNEAKMQTLESVFLPVLERRDKARKGAV